MKYYIPVEIMSSNSPVLEIANNLVESKVAFGQYVSDKSIVDVVHVGAKITSPNIGDFMTTPYPVVSEAIACVIKDHQIPLIELIPSRIKIDNKTFDNYYILNSTNVFKCIDINKSDIRTRSAGAITKIRSLVLDQDVISGLDEKNKDIFRLEEKSDIYIYSSDITKKIQKISPKNLKFILVEEWYSTIVFDV